VNLLYVDVPPPEAQILLRVKFASVDRSLSTQLGLNILSTGAANTIGSIPRSSSPLLRDPASKRRPGRGDACGCAQSLLLPLRSESGATIQALEVKGLLQVLSEPNVLAENGKQASFLAGGEFPFPSVSAPRRASRWFPFNSASTAYV
jgi:pilus assembly protein CpaC